MAVSTQHVTLERFLQLPEERPGLEYIDGEITQKVSPTTKHVALQLELCDRLNAVARHRKLGRAFPELRVTFSGQSRVPDVAFYIWDRIPEDPNGELANDALEPPDIAVEIPSPGQSTNSLVRRALWFAAHGVRIALVIDPDDRSVIAYRPDGRATAWYGVDEIDLSDVLPDFHLTVDELFQTLRKG
jgi:Uma2 family endonuclease